MGGMRVLLVEDEIAAAQMLAKGLREQAYAVDVSHEGNDASFRLATTNYDAVILDVTLPGKDGLELAREARDAGSPAMSPTRSDAASDAPGQAVVTKVALRTLTGRWFVPQLGTSVVIQPVEDDPRFHVIYVEDSTKAVRGTHALDEAQQQKLQRQRQFQEQLNEERKAQEAREQ